METRTQKTINSFGEFMRKREYNENWGYLVGIRPVKKASRLLSEGKTDDEIIANYFDDHETPAEAAQLALSVAKAEKPIIDEANPRGVSLYIHIPFCPSRCLYCSFSSRQSECAPHLIPDYLHALHKELAAALELVKHNENVIETIYIGGGTPTVLSATQLDKLLTPLSNIKVKEFTVEAGRPDTLTREKLAMLKRHNVSRISINPQTMNDEILSAIGRNHTAAQTRSAVTLARECGFNNINMDIIAGLPNETFDMFRTTVEQVLALEPENITVHAMCVKRPSELKEQLENHKMTDGKIVQQMIKFARETLTEHGFLPYYLYRQKYILGDCENVGYSKPEFLGIYNIHMMSEIQPIIAVGAGSVTKIFNRETGKIERIFNVKEAIDYINRVDEMIDRKPTKLENFTC